MSWANVIATISYLQVHRRFFDTSMLAFNLMGKFSIVYAVPFLFPYSLSVFIFPLGNFYHACIFLGHGEGEEKQRKNLKLYVKVCPGDCHQKAFTFCLIQRLRAGKSC